MKPITFIILVFLLVIPVSAMQVCNCDRGTNPNAYCVSVGNTIMCDENSRLIADENKHTTIEEYNPDGSKEYPIHWDINNPSGEGKGWYYYVSPNRPFYFPYYYPIFVNK